MSKSYTGMDLILSKGKTRYNSHKNITNLASIDRIDSNKGYTIDNIQFVSATVNLLKQSLSHDDFISLIKIIAARF